MRKLMAVALLSVCIGSAFGGENRDAQPGYFKAELESVLAENGGRPIGEFEVAELDVILNELSVAAQKDAYVKQSQMLSFMAPGLGELKNGDVGAGALFLLADTAVAAGTLLGSYFLLPEDLRFSQLDYFNTPYSGIRDQWESHTFMDYLPTMAVLTGGWLVSSGLRCLSAKRAGKAARRSIEEGAVTFEPKVGLAAAGAVSLGVKMKY